MKKLLLIITLCCSSFSFGQMAVVDATANKQLIQLQNQTRQIMAQNKALLSSIQQMQRISIEENQSKKQAPNHLLYSARLNELNQIRLNIVDAGKKLSSNVKDMKHLKSNDYSYYTKNTTTIVQNTVQVYNQIKALLNLNGAVIPANERLQALDSSFDVLTNNLNMIKSYNSSLTSLNKAKSIQNIR